jgi:hypothetical protein
MWVSGLFYLLYDNREAGKNMILTLQLSTNTDVIGSSKQNKIGCSTVQGDPTDAIETTNTGGTSLRDDTNGGTFILNWKTPTGQASNCYSTTITTVDASSSITAYFKLN